MSQSYQTSACSSAEGRWVRGALPALCSFALLALGCSERPPYDIAAARSPDANVILISIDTLRADRLGAYGYDRPTSPNVDALARRGVRFETAIAESSWTLPSHATLLTGTLPRTHRTDKYFFRKIPQDIPLLAEILRARGYRTFAYAEGGFMSASFGFGRGFETYEGVARFDRALALAQERITSLGPDERYFLFLHTFDVHCPYDVSEEIWAAFRTSSSREHFDARLCSGAAERPNSHSAIEAQALSERYDAAIHQMDRRLGSFLEFLDDRGALENTVVVFTSDHGEAFGEHDQLGHGVSLYVESLRVPLIVVAPRIRPGVVSDGVGLVDVTPTILDVLSIVAAGTEGTSLLPTMMGAPPTPTDRPRERPLFSELSVGGRLLRSVVSKEQHLITDLKTNERELFDWRRDPAEERPLRHDNDAAISSLLDEYLRGAPLTSGTEDAAPREAREFEPSEQLIEQLRNLGYIR